MALPRSTLGRLLNSVRPQVQRTPMRQYDQASRRDAANPGHLEEPENPGASSIHEYVHRGREYVNGTYFGLSGAPAE